MCLVRTARVFRHGAADLTRTCRLHQSSRRWLNTSATIRAASLQEIETSVLGLLRVWDKVFPDCPQWSSRLRVALERLRGEKARPFTRIAVVGTPNSGSDLLVSTLLLDPPNPDFLVQERRRHHALDQPLLLSPDAGTVAAAISTKSSWLKDNALELVECPLSRETLPQLSHTAVDAVLSSDILLLAFSDADDPQTCAALMQQFRHHPSLLILVNQLVSTRPDSFKAQMATHLSTSSTVPVLSFDSRQAFALSENNTLSSYTDDLSSSHTTQVAQSLVNQAASANPSSSLRMVLRQAVQVIEDARKESTFAIQTSSDACQAATSAVEALHQQSYLNVQPSLPQQAKDHSRAVFEYAFNKRLAWWKLPFGRADDVMAELGQAAQVAWKRSESHTLFEAGRFEGLRQELDASTDVLASIPPLQLGGPYHSAVLRNQVEQLVESGRTRISVDDALEPYEQRRKQVIGPGGLAESAYRQAQTVVLGNYLVLLGTSAASYMSVLAEVAQWPTAATGGAFGAVWASWRLQKGWEKVKRRFLANLDRLHDGLAEDLSAFGSEASSRATMKTQRLVEGFQSASNIREADLLQARDLVQSCQKQLDET